MHHLYCRRVSFHACICPTGTVMGPIGWRDRGVKMRGVRLLGLVIRNSGIGSVLTGWLILYLVLALVILFFEPEVTNYGDALWFLWAVSTTVGLGDVTAVTPIGRLATVICSITAILVVAIFTGVVVDFTNERRNARLNESASVLLDKLERLPELTKDELVDISKKIRHYRS